MDPNQITNFVSLLDDDNYEFLPSQGTQNSQPNTISPSAFFQNSSRNISTMGNVQRPQFFQHQQNTPITHHGSQYPLPPFQSSHIPQFSTQFVPSHFHEAPSPQFGESFTGSKGSNTTSRSRGERLNLNENAEASDDVEGGAREAVQPAKQKASRQRWTEDHDLKLVSCWLQASKDPIVSNNQTGDSYWKKIANRLNELCPEVRRIPNQVKSHWHTNSALCQTFQGCYVRAKGLRKSGWCDQDYLDEAHRLYKEEKNGNSFRLEYMWKILKDERKWTEKESSENASKKTRINEQGSWTTSGENRTSDGPSNTSRPIGRDTAKRYKKKGKAPSTSGSDVITEVYKDVETKKLEMMQRLADNQEKKMEIAARKLRHNLIHADVSKMTEYQRLAHEKEIREFYGL